MITPRHALIALATLLAACGPESVAPRTTVRDSSGVRIATTDGPDSRLPWRLVAIDSIGGDVDSTGPTSFYHVGRFGVGADDSGRVYVLDVRGRRVVVADARGRVLRTMGRNGEGPGEFRNGTSMAVAPAGAVAVFDFARMGFVTYGPDGSPGPVLVLGESAPSFEQRHFAYWGDQMAIARRRRGTGPQTTTYLAASTLHDTTALVSMTRPVPPMVIYQSCAGGLSLPPIFTPELRWATAGDRLVVARTAAYNIERFTPDGRRMVIRRAMAAREATVELATRELGEGMRINFGQGSCTIDPAEMAERRGFAATVPAIREIRLDREGRLWVQRRMVGGAGSEPIDIFDTTGRYLGTLTGQPMPVVFLGEGRLGWISEDGSGVQRLVLGRIETTS